MTDPRGGAKAWHLAPILLIVVLATDAAASNPFGNVVNEPFASVASGPQGAIVVNRDMVRTAAAAESAVADAIRSQHSVHSLRHARNSMRTLQRLGVRSPRAQPTFPRRVVHISDGQIVAPDLMRARANGERIGAPTNEIRFTFEGFSSAQETALRDYLRRAVPVAYNVYGRPAFDIDVTIRLDPELRTIQGGVYDATQNEIRMAPLSGNLAEDSYVLLILVLHAFHDDVAFFYDVWEQGFAGAAATVIQTRSGVAPGYDPIDPGPFYATSVYEPQNQPELGGPTFYPESDWSGMLVWRVAMARSAWFKCWVEDRDFFRNFNEAYYDSFTDDLPGNVPALRELAAGVLPQVEGMPFQEWFQRQWVFDTSIRIGKKLFVWNIPLDRSVALIAQHYYTTFTGDEEPRGGQARTTYWSYDFAVSLFAEEGNTISIPSEGDGAGEGFLIPTFFNIGGPQNVTVQVDLGSIRKMLPFTYGKRGFEVGENNLYGSTIDAIRGTIDVEGGRGLSDVTVNRGVWGDRITQGSLSPQQLVVTFTNEQEQEVSRTINVAWDSYVVFMKGSRQVTLTREFSADPPGIHLISFPLQPLSQDLAGLLGIDPTRFLLARWDPRAPGENKYTIWPRTDPVQPGRAYFMRIFSDLSLSLAGSLEPEDSTSIVPIHVGWNMIGPPRRQPVEVSSLRVEAESEAPVSYQEAVDRRIIQEGVFGYSAAEGYTQRSEMVPFEGYWIRCLRADGALIRFAPVNRTTATAVDSTSSGTVADLEWQFLIIAEAAGLRGSARIAAASDAQTGADRYDMQAPPGFGPRVTVELMREGDPNGYYRDVRPSGAPEQTWNVRVRSNVPDAPMRLSWPDLGALPENIRPILVDEATDRRACMRTTTAYELAGGPDGVDRRLQVRCLPRAAQSLIVPAVTARQASASAAEIVFSLSAPADVELEVLNIAGRTIRIIPAGQRPAGQNTLNWNLRDRGGTLVPSGLYIVRLRAHGDEGRRANALGTLQVTR